MQYDYLIVGSGITGAVFAHEARKRGASCLVLEKRDHIGGNLYCEETAGIHVHKYGAHIFHTSDTAIWSYINQFAEFNHYRNSPIANYNGTIYNLPFNMNTFCKMWNISRPEEAAKIIEQQRAEITTEPQNLEEQAIYLVGRDIYETLIKGYTEKQWGKPCSDLPAFIIRRLPVRFTYDNNYFDDCYQGIPIGSYNQIIHTLLNGCDVQLRCDYNTNRNHYNAIATRVIYTGMIDAFFDYCFGPLQYRSLRFEHEILETPNYQGVAVVNYTSKNPLYTRIIEHKHFAFGTQPKTVITKEYPSDWKVGMEAYYPINDSFNQQLFEQYQTLADQQPNILFCGRLAQYKYYDMDDAIAAALAVVEKEFS